MNCPMCDKKMVTGTYTAYTATVGDPKDEEKLEIEIAVNANFCDTHRTQEGSYQAIRTADMLAFSNVVSATMALLTREKSFNRIKDGMNILKEAFKNQGIHVYVR